MPNFDTCYPNKICGILRYYSGGEGSIAEREKFAANMKGHPRFDGLHPLIDKWLKDGDRHRLAKAIRERG